MCHMGWSPSWGDTDLSTWQAETEYFLSWKWYLFLRIVYPPQLVMCSDLTTREAGHHRKLMEYYALWLGNVSKWSTLTGCLGPSLVLLGEGGCRGFEVFPTPSPVPFLLNFSLWKCELNKHLFYVISLHFNHKGQELSSAIYWGHICHLPLGFSFWWEWGTG